MEQALQGNSDLGQQNEGQDAEMEQGMAGWLSDEYLYLEPQRGDIRTATILTVKPDEVMVDIGAKVTGVVLERDLERLDEETIESLEPGAEIPVYILNPDWEEAALVSISMALSMQDWQRAHEYMDEEEIIEEEITGFNKGGLLIQFGQIQGFVPASQVISMRRGSQGQDYQQALQDLVGEELPLKVIEVDHRRRRLILSERQARREWRQAQKEEFLEELEESQIRTGVVTSFCDFGAFVNLGVMDGLIHISELSWKRVDKPSDVLELGQEIEVYVLSVDRERERIALSLKRLQPDPWEEAAGKYQEGQLVECVITNVVRFGAFARLEPGIEGLVHISELAEGPVREPEDIVQVGERLLLKVIRVDMERHRIALSLRQVTADDRASWYLASEPEPEEEEEPAWDEEDVVAGLDEPELDEAVEEDVGDGDIGEEGIDAEDTGEEDIGEEGIDEESSDEEKVEEIDTEEEEQLEESAE